MQRLYLNLRIWGPFCTLTICNTGVSTSGISVFSDKTVASQFQRWCWDQNSPRCLGQQHDSWWSTVYPKKYAHGFCFAVLCCGYTLTDFSISTRLTSLALWQSNDCPSASKATLMNMDKYFMWIHYERLHSHNKAKHNKTVCIFLGIYCKILVPHATSIHTGYSF